MYENTSVAPGSTAMLNLPSKSVALTSKVPFTRMVTLGNGMSPSTTVPLTRMV